VRFPVGTSSAAPSTGLHTVAPGLQFMSLFIGTVAESRNVWIVCLLCIAAIALAAWLAAMRRRRRIGDTPTSKIVSAAQGFVELQGIGRPFPDNPVRSPLNGLPCLWYLHTVEEKDSDGKWQQIQRSESDISFVLDDGTGTCLVDPEGAEIICHRKERATRGGQRITEWKLIERDPVYALGEFKTFGGHHLELDPQADLKELLNDWKKEPATLRQRFDLDGDGEISETEWELVRAAAKREIAKQHQETRQQADSHVMKKPRDGRNYLISSLDPDKLARRYGLWAAFHLAVFFAALAAIPWAWWNFD